MSKPFNAERVQGQLEAHWRALCEIRGQLESAGRVDLAERLQRLCAVLDDIAEEVTPALVESPVHSCRQCGLQPCPPGSTVTCGASECQQAEYQDNAARARIPRRARGAKGRK